MSFDPTPYNEQGHGAAQDPVITRGNYEMYFLLYLDNELSADLRRQVESFVQLHPDLKEELEILSQFRLEPDTSITFEPKAELMRSEPEIPEHLIESLLLYTDDELSAADSRELEKAIAGNPALQKELNLLGQTKLQADTSVVFPDKSSLYRKEEKVRVVYFNWRRIAVAAVLLLSFGLSLNWYLNRKTSPKQTETAGINPGKQPVKGTNVNKANTNEQTSGKEDQSPLIQTPGTGNNIREALAAQQNTVVPQTQKQTTTQDPAVIIPNKVNDQQAIAYNDPQQQQQPQSNNLAQPTNNPNVINGLNTGAANPVAMIEQPDTHTNPASGVINASYPVTKTDLNPSDYTDDGQSPGGKNKLRGFFRKVTRTFEKKTNINTTDDDRLLVGGLAIRLK